MDPHESKDAAHTRRVVAGLTKLAAVRLDRVLSDVGARVVSGHEVLYRATKRGYTRRARPLATLVLAPADERDAADLEAALVAQGIGWSREWVDEFKRPRRPLCRVLLPLRKAAAAALHKLDERARAQRDVGKLIVGALALGAAALGRALFPAAPAFPLLPALPELPELPELPGEVT